MNVASLELCKELYELSGWAQTYFIWMDLQDQEPFVSDGKTGGIRKADGTPGTYQDAFDGGTDWLPAYDLGYLMRKLQTELEAGKDDYTPKDEFLLDCLYDIWTCRTTWNKYKNYSAEADTPEDCAAKLAIELFKQGILKHE